MPEALRDPHSASIRISSRSVWSDPRWLFDGLRPGLRAHRIAVDWDFVLPDGSRFTDSQWMAWLEDARRFLWSLQVDPPRGRRLARSSTLATTFYKVRMLIRWMVAQNITSFAALDRDTVERFLADMAARPGKRATTLSASTRHSYANLMSALYLQRRKLRSAPQESPFGGERASTISGFAGHAMKRMPHTPDAIAVPLLAASIRLLGCPADDVIALRNQAQSLYETLWPASGLSRVGVRQRVLAAIAAFRFSTIAGEEAPWHPAPVIGTKRVRFLVERLYDACFVTIAYLVGARVSEILALEAGCLERHPSADRLDSFAYLRGRIFKTAASEEGEAHLWVAPPPVVRAIEVLEALSEPLRQRTGRAELWLSMQGHGVIETRPIDVITSNTIVSRLNQHYAPFIALPAHNDGQAWHLTTHQGRKTFARFVGKRDRTGLHALQAHFGHVTRIMTDRAYVGTDFELGELIDAQTLEETRVALEELLTASQLGGRAGRMIAARSRFRGRTMEEDFRAYIDFIIAESGMRLGVCDWGYCLYRTESAACLGSEEGPNPVWRTESTCATCANFAVSERHRPVWEVRRAHNQDLLTQVGLDPQSRALAEARIAECDRILTELSCVTDGDDA